MMKPFFILFFLFLFLISPVSAGDPVVDISDQVDYERTATTDFLINRIEISGFEPVAGRSLSIETDTYIFSCTVSSANSYSATLDFSIEDLVTGNTSTSTDTHYFIPGFSDLSFHFGDPLSLTGVFWYGDNFFGIIDIGGFSERPILYASNTISISSDDPIDLKIYELQGDSSTSSVLTNYVLDIIDGIPFLGPQIVTALVITGTILSMFFDLAAFVLEAGPAIILAIETFILLRAIIIMQGRGKYSKRLSRAIESIASDNKKLFEFLYSAFIAFLNLIYSVIQAIGSWIPFT